MKIILHDQPADDVIAHEDQLGDREGEFRVEEGGAIFYHHPSDEMRWFAGPDSSTFRAAAEAFASYQKTVSGCSSEEEELRVVGELRARLDELGLLDRPDAFWGIIVEQAEHGSE
ncbi:MAG: hypothetical protein U0414_36620 [Polyangiaceae bacterium]